MSVLRYLLIVVGALLLLVCGGAGYLYWSLSYPPMNRLPLPDSLISLESPEGAALLEQSQAKADFASLQTHFEAQSKTSWCGVASAVIAHNALDPAAPMTQDAFFNECTAP